MSSLSVTVEHPSAHITVATESGMLSFVGKTAMYSTTFDGDVLSLTTTRDMSQDCPTFSMNIVYRRDWFTKISTNDLLIIALHRPPESKGNVLVGLVDDIRKTTDFSTGKPVRAFTLTGRGFNKALLNFGIGTVSELTVTASIQGFFSNMLDIFSGASPAVIIKGVLDNYIGMGCNYSFANGKKFKDYYQESIKDVSSGNEFLADATSFTSFQGGLWDFLKELKNAPFNEMFWEIINDRPTLIFRPTPFNENNWNNLQSITIKDVDIIGENLGRSDLETYVVFKVKAETFSGDTDILGYLPYWYPPYYPKYGINRLEVYSKYLEYDGNDLSTIEDKMKDIFNWNIKNNIMENGTLTVKGLNCYKVGTRVKIESTGMEYYCEGVTHSFNFGTGWTTTLSLTRGLKPTERFTPPWGCYKRMTTEDVSKIYGYTVTDADIDPISGASMNGATDGVVPTSGSSGGVSQKIQELVKIFPDGSNFTTSGNSCPAGHGSACSNCYYPNVVNQRLGWGWKDMYPSYSCYGFTCFVTRYVFGTEWPKNSYVVGTANLSNTSACDSLLNQAKIGDVVSIGTAHRVIFLQKASNGMMVYDSNQGDKNGLCNKVRYNKTMSFSGLYSYYGGVNLELRRMNNYNDVGGSSSSSGSTGGNNKPASGNNNELEVYKFVTGRMGLNTAAACGILANIEHESGFKYDLIVTDSNGLPSGGLCMWNGPRLKSLQNYCSRNGYNYLSLEGQLNYLQYELKNSYPSVWNKLSSVSNSASGAYDAAYYWCYYYEVPANRASRSVTRGNTAKNKYWPNYS